MIADLRPYPAMKDSGVEWLGEVPEHWRVERGKWLFRHKKQVNADGAETNVLSLTLRGVVNNDPENPEGLVPKDYGTYQLFRRGDLVFKLIDLENLRTSRVGLVHEDGIMSSAYVRLFPQVDLNIRFFYRQYFDLYQRGIYNQLGAGVRSTLGPKDLVELRLVLPPLSEQAAIVRVLDYVDRRVRRLVRAKRKLIALLMEQKQAIIHRAVTRGLDPDVPLKDSGVEWLGKVPAHWGFNRGKYYFREVDVRSATGEEELLSVSHITGVTPRSQKNITMFKAASYVGSKVCTPGQIAVNTMWAWMAAIGVSDYHGLVSSSYHTYEQLDSDTFTDEYLDLLLRSNVYKMFYTVSSSGITTSRLRLYPDDFLNIRFLCPPREEQAAILEWLHDTTADIDTTISRANREISLLNEYRTRLIADVVTGKLDVREAAAALPEVDPLDAEDDLDNARETDAEAEPDDLEAIPEEAEA